MIANSQSHIANGPDFRRLAGVVRADLDRADIGGRARRLAEFAVKVTLVRGRTRVIIPNRQPVCDLLKIGKNHVKKVVFELESARIVRCVEVADGWELLFFPDSRQWLVDWIYEQQEMADYLATLDRAAGQAQRDFGANEVSFEPDPDLDRALAELGATMKSREVPKMGTPFKGVETLKNQTSKSYRFDSLNFKERTESLKWALCEIEHGDEQRAVAGIRMVLGADVMERDGGKWRNRFRSNPSKVHRVMAAVVERMGQVVVRETGAEAEERWKEFADR